MLPNFLVIGARKGGTTSLSRYLRGHPQVFIPSVTEPLFFSSNWDRGRAWYESLFDEAGQARAIGEKSTEYTTYPLFSGVPKRIAKLLPDVRLVYLVRHPIERMLSEYHYYVKRGMLRDHSAEHALLHDGYWYLSSYAMQIEQYLEYFPRDQLLIAKSEDLKSDRIQTLKRVYEFLGVDASVLPKHMEREHNRTPEGRVRRPVDKALRRIPGYGAAASVAPRSLARVKNRLTMKKAPSRPTLSDSARREIEDRLRDDVRRLRKYMGDDFDGWGVA
jgi:hypothetical protein